MVATFEGKNEFVQRAEAAYVVCCQAGVTNGNAVRPPFLPLAERDASDQDADRTPATSVRTHNLEIIAHTTPALVAQIEVLTGRRPCRNQVSRHRSRSPRRRYKFIGTVLRTGSPGYRHMFDTKLWPTRLSTRGGRSSRTRPDVSLKRTIATDRLAGAPEIPPLHNTWMTCSSV